MGTFNPYDDLDPHEYDKGIDLDSYEYDDNIDRSITCKRCGQDDLHWDYGDDEKYHLYDEDGERHVCEPSIDGLEALPNESN